MCGIVGAVSANKNIVDILSNGLQQLEYRGYDSAGISIYSKDKGFQRTRVRGKVSELKQKILEEGNSGYIGIAHTRWATHGAPNEDNAHPHVSGNLTLVHNGIIENYQELANEIEENGYKRQSQTDTEVMAHYIHYIMSSNKCTLLKAIQIAVKKFEGSYGMAIFDSSKPDEIIVARSGSPIIVGLGEGYENFITSDQLAIINETNKFIYLQEGDIAVVTFDAVKIYNNEKDVSRPVVISELSGKEVSKQNYEYFMLKEIYEQPQVFFDALEGRVSSSQVLVDSFGIGFKDILEKVESIKIVACGTAYNSGLVAKYWFESIAKVSCDVEIASEYRYRDVVVGKNTLFIAISQSGETADVLAALKKAKELNYLNTLSICNVSTSSLVRESDLTILVRAGIEVGVASTKSFTNQLLVLSLLNIALAKVKGRISLEEENNFINSLGHASNNISKFLSISDKIKELSKDFVNVNSTLFIARGELYPVVIEGSLKLKELSYIHAEAYASGELKHGPLALVDKDMPVIALAPNNKLLDKVTSNIEEVAARSGRLYIFTDVPEKFANLSNSTVINVPSVSPEVAPICYGIIMQLISYHIAYTLGKDIDKPRNLAKSVTVE